MLKKWVSTPVSTNIISNPEPAFNLPWYSDQSEEYTCVGNIISQSLVKENGFNKTSLQFQMKGSINSATCFDMTLNGNKYRYVTKIVSTSNVYDFDFMLHCGNIINTEPYSNDENKPGIKNGISCSCPSGPGNAQFSPCPFEIKSNGTFAYNKYFPQGIENPTLTMCHSLNPRGQAHNCIFTSSKTTDYYIKFLSHYEMLPLFSLKMREIKELVMKLIIYNSDNEIVHSEIFPLSLLDPVLFAPTISNFQVSLQTIQASMGSVNNYAFITSFSNFTDLNKIYTIDKDLLNPYSDFDLDKLCYIKKKSGFPIEVRKWMIDDRFTEAFLPKKCYNPAEGLIQNPFTSFHHLLNPSNLFSSRFSPESYDLFPGETSLLKEINEVSITFNYMFDVPVETETQLNVCSIKTFSYVCQESLNQDGFHCDLSFSSLSDGQTYLLINDSNTIVQVFNSKSETVYRKTVIIDPLYTSDEKVTLCMGCSYNNLKICSTSKLTYNESNNVDQPDIEDPDISNGNDSGGSGVKNKDGSLKTWLRVVIGVLAAIFFVFIIYLIWPLLSLLAMFTRKMGKSMKDKFNKASEEMKMQDDPTDLESLRKLFSKK